jgi:hypothetical protein
MQDRNIVASRGNVTYFRRLRSGILPELLRGPRPRSVLLYLSAELAVT